jgi:hypothetical protein
LKKFEESSKCQTFSECFVFINTAPKANESDYEEGELIPDLNETETSPSLITQSQTDSNHNIVNTTVTLSQYVVQIFLDQTIQNLILYGLI